MERHVLGHEGMEDSPVARWARELRAALGCADEADEDRDAVAWVRERGGLESVKSLLGWVVGHCSTSQQLDFDFWLSGRVMHELGFEGDMADRDEVERRLLARLMPEGMEWPRYEDGEPVSIGDVVGDVKVRSVVLREDGIILSDCTSVPGWGTWRSYKEPIRRPAPKVLDADGVEIRVGDEVYDVETGCKRTVRVINLNGTVEFDGYMNCGWFANRFTHRAPVLAADGKPLREGETVWDAKGNGPYVIKAIEADGVIRIDGNDLDHFGSDFVHERPDSWERLEEDATLAPAAYCHDMGLACACDPDPDAATYIEAMARDIVRRAKALAGGA